MAARAAPTVLAAPRGARSEPPAALVLTKALQHPSRPVLVVPPQKARSSLMSSPLSSHLPIDGRQPSGKCVLRGPSRSNSLP